MVGTARGSSCKPAVQCGPADWHQMMDSRRAGANLAAASEQLDDSMMMLADECNRSGNLLIAQTKRKEKARIAARARRSQEASIIMEMANELHISQERMRRTDKATIVKLAIDYIRALHILSRFKPPSQAPDQMSAADSMQDQTREPAGCQPQLELIAHYPEQQTSQMTDFTDCQLEQQLNCEQQQQQQHKHRPEEQDENDQAAAYELVALHSAPKLTTASIFAPKTADNSNSHFLMIENDLKGGGAALVLRPDTEIQEDDDLTHLAPQAGDVRISLDAEPLDGIMIDFASTNCLLNGVQHLPLATAAAAAARPMMFERREEKIS